MIIRLHGEKVLFSPKKKRKKMNKLPDLYTYVHFRENEFQRKLEKQQRRTALFQFGFLLKSKDIYRFGSELFFLLYRFLFKNYTISAIDENLLSNKFLSIFPASSPRS